MKLLFVEVVEGKSMQHLGEEEIYKPFLEKWWPKGLNNDEEDDTRSSLISTGVPCCPSEAWLCAGGR